MNRWFGALGFPIFLGVVVAWFLRVAPFSPDESGYHLEMDLLSPSTGETWLQFDIGHGRNFHDQRTFWVTGSDRPQTYRVDLPSGMFRAFAIVPPATMHQVLAGARVVAEDGTIAARVPALRDVPERHSIVFEPAHPLELYPPDRKSWPVTALDFFYGAVVVLLLRELARRRGGPALQERLRSLAQAATTWASAHPRWVLLGTAALATAVSCHPVLFFGKSFVSPNNGALCLYDAPPTVPGAPARPVESWAGSDINAIMWAHLPYSTVAHDAILRDGELPLWNRHVMCGLTLLGQGQSMIGDPLYWMTLLADGASWAWDTRFLISKVLFSFGVGLLIWRTIRSLGLAALLAFSSSFIGYFSFRFNHPAFFSLCYAPWILLCWLSLAEAGTLRHAGWMALTLLGANWLELNSGTAKEACMLMLALNGAGMLTLLFGSEPWLLRAKKLALASASGVVFLAISAPLWVVFLDALHHGYTIYDKPLTNQLPPGLFLGLFDDLFFRELLEREWYVDPSLNFLVLLGLCWAAADVRAWLGNPVARALLIVAALALAMAFCVIPPALIDRLPFLKNIAHVDDTFICVAVVPLFILSGFGLKSCLEKMREPRAWRSAWQVTLLIIGGLAALYFGTVQAVPGAQGFGLQLARPTEFSPFFAGYALALFAAIVLLPWLARWARGSRSPLAPGLAIFLCLAAIHFRHGLWLETKFDGYVVNPQKRVDLHGPSPAVEFIRDRQGEPARTMGFGLILRPGFNIVERLEGPTGADAVTTLELAQWYEAAGLGSAAIWWPTVGKANIAATKPYYDAMNVRYYLGAVADAAHPAPSLEKISAADLEVFESKSAWPRAFFTDRLARYSDVRLLLQWVKNGDGRPFAAVEAGEPDAPAPVPDQATRQISAARDYRLTSNTTSFTIDAPAAGVAVLNESFLPENFHAFLNGHRVPYFRVNHIFKGVALPGPGTYQLRFEYWPKPLSAALWVAAGGLLALLGGAVALWRTPRASAKT